MKRRKRLRKWVERIPLEIRYGMVLMIHPLPRGSIERIAMAHCLRKMFGRRYDQSILDQHCVKA